MQEWDKTSWWDFWELDKQRTEFQILIGWSISQDLIAVNPHKASTRMLGYSLLQMFYSLLLPNHGIADRVLDGPADIELVTPWVNELQKKGCHLNVNTRLYNINYDESANKIRSMHILNTITGELKEVTGDQFILAVPIEVAIPFLRHLKGFDKVLQGWDKSILDNKWMTGFQVYLKNDITVINGQIGIGDSPWAVSFLSENQFWRDSLKMKTFGDHKAAGVISCIISNWENPGQFTNKTAQDCSSADEIITEAWKQIRFRFPEFPDLNNPAVISYNLDPAIDFSHGHAENMRPLFSVNVNSWEYRPEAYTSIGNFKLAADFIRTFAQSATMEGANEAGKRAVNSILSDDNRTDLIQIFDFWEPEIFKFFQCIDQFRWDHHLPPLQLNIDEKFFTDPNFISNNFSIDHEAGTVTLK